MLINLNQINNHMNTYQQFEAKLHVIINDFVEYIKPFDLPSPCPDLLKELLQYNTLGGKLNRGISVVDTVKMLKPEEPQLIEKAYMLGWCVELLQTFFLIADDIMDASQTRRGKLCWYKKVGLSAINDTLIIESVIYFILKKEFKQFECYVDLVELFHEITLKTELGQMVDLITAPENIVDLDKFSLEKQLFISTYKTAYYTFYLPTIIAFLVCGINDTSLFNLAQHILIKIGQYFQIQDDYLDCFGEPEHIGKIGTDIQDNKCSWVICTAKEHAKDDQLNILKENYGIKEEACVSKVKEIFNELKITHKYTEYEKVTYDHLVTEINKVNQKEIRDVFLNILNKIHKRDK